MARKSKAERLANLMERPGVASLPSDRRDSLARIFGYLVKHDLTAFRIGTLILTHNQILAETKIETQKNPPNFDPEIALGLLSIETDGAIACPALQLAKVRAIASIARVRAARENGKKGGRPRKIIEQPANEIPPKSVRPSEQRHLMLAVDCGKSKNPPAARVSQRLILSNIDNKIDKIDKIIVSETEFREVGEAVLAAMDIDPARSWLDYGLVRQWLADGADRELILEVVTRLSADAKRRGRDITTLKYFTRAIWEAKAVQPAKKPAWEKEYDRQQAYYELMCGTVPRPNLAEIKAKFAA